jgi:hypothetical protein
MKIKEVHDRFDLFIDKTANPYFSRDERDLLINQAARIYLQQQFKPNSESPFEARIQEAENITELLVAVSVSTDVNGKLLYSAINAAIPAVVKYTQGVANGTYAPNKWYRFLTFGRTYTPAAVTLGYTVNYGGTDPGSTAPISGGKVLSKYVRHADYHQLKSNKLTAFTEAKPRHRFFDNYLEFYPTGVRQIEIALIRYPVPVSYDIADFNDADSDPGVNAVDLEFSDKVCDSIIALAVGLVGVSIREEELITGSQVLKND